ncbi:SigE family RNA polymerase sigma factor [Tessaracoccus sp. HDW20]|uniref:SigE family RNA polymerase sigma factor n=1 Tax=Tessaracoccus coleopterorum TaxID=2714950 RepID=UPI0018D38E23|nr:SigE family RNA polymerase sigma factor [Tessaracoccus coleopterorum]NHB83849.1 SigE family RNA polymerase sigma factor [Tessaracoccus coleopterorum]
MEDAASRFDRFVEARGGELWAAAWLLTGDPHHAEDLVQSALLKCYPKYPRFDADRAFEAYVRKAIYRTFISWWRKRSWRSEVPGEVRDDGAAHTDAVNLTPELGRALLALPRAQRAVLVLRYFEDRTAVDTARLLGMPDSTVASHTRRGLAALRGVDAVAELRSMP